MPTASPLPSRAVFVTRLAHATLTAQHPLSAREFTAKNGWPHWTNVWKHYGSLSQLRQIVTQFLAGDDAVTQALWREAHPQCLLCGAEHAGECPQEVRIPKHLQTRSAFYRRLGGLDVHRDSVA